MLRDRKPRLCNSLCTVSEIEECLQTVFSETKDREVVDMFSVVANRWTASTMPPPSELVRPAFLTLARLFVNIDSTLNPSKTKVTMALLALHKDDPCLFGQTLAERLAGQAADNMRLCLSKYRELGQKRHKWLSLVRKVYFSMFAKMGTL